MCPQRVSKSDISQSSPDQNKMQTDAGSPIRATITSLTVSLPRFCVQNDRALLQPQAELSAFSGHSRPERELGILTNSPLDVDLKSVWQTQFLTCGPDGGSSSWSFASSQLFLNRLNAIGENAKVPRIGIIFLFVPQRCARQNFLGYKSLCLCLILNLKTAKGPAS
jgi:hypothetical protein